LLNGSHLHSNQDKAHLDFQCKDLHSDMLITALIYMWFTGQHIET